jgi:thioredoxin 1
MLRISMWIGTPVAIEATTTFADTATVHRKPPMSRASFQEKRAMKNTTEFNDANFEAEVLTSDRPVLVDFWAAWCGPCRAVSPTIEALAEQYGATVKVGKLNVDENPDTAQRFGISSIPTVLLFKDGEVVETLVGVRTREQYEAALNRYAAVV